MKLQQASVEWAIRSIERHGDTDLFPRPAELKAILDDIPGVIAKIADTDLTSHLPSPPRRFIVPKSDLSYRPATQLDVVDSLILTALMYEFGQNIENRRRPLNERCVHSYRFSPSVDGDLYSAAHAWNGFWFECLRLAHTKAYALVLDIADFYNQIYHHTVENQLIASGLPNQATKWIIRLLEATTAKVSRSVPIGPHATHLLAEASLIPVDNSLAARRFTFRRYVDDIVLFFETEAEARAAVYSVASILDKQQRLQLQNGKTKIMEAAQFKQYCRNMIADRPINDLEENIIELIGRYANRNPYRSVFINQLAPEDLRAFKPSTIETIVAAYLAAEKPDFVRLRWFIRRLAQVGHPAGVQYLLDNIEQLIPALSDICHYFISVSSQGMSIDWPRTGDQLLTLLSSPIVQANEYFQLSILSLFGREPQLNHIDRLISQYPIAPPHLRREIILAAAAGGAVDWLRELKEEAQSMDPWTRSAYYFATKGFPSDERRFFLQFANPDSVLEKIVAKWAKA